MAIVFAMIAILCCVASATAAGTPKLVGYPNSIAAIGDSWETGFGTNATGEVRDVWANNWVTGTNPVVDSFYERILAVNPKIKGRVHNVASDGSGALDFMIEASFLNGIHVDLIVEALGSNSLCAAEPLKQFGTEMGDGMRQLALEHPDARILMVGIGLMRAIWIAAGAGTARPGSATGACDPKYDAQGKPSPAQLALLKRRETAYNAVLRSICAGYVHCRYDGVSTRSTSNSPISPSRTHSIRGRPVRRRSPRQSGPMASTSPTRAYPSRRHTVPAEGRR